MVYEYYKTIIMKLKLQYIFTAFKVEWLKIKGLGLLLTGLIISAISPLITFIIMIAFENSRNYDGFETSVFTKFLENSYSLFGGFFLLIFIIISAIRIAQSDHRNNGWNFIETQPLSKFSIYFGKFLSVSLLSTICIFLFYLITFATAAITQLIFPQESYNFDFELSVYAYSFFRLCLLSLSIISMQMMFSMIFKGVILPFVAGFLGFVINIVAQVRGEVYDFVPFNNLNIGLGFFQSYELNYFLNYTEYLSIFWTIVYLIIGYWVYSQKGISNALLGSTKKIIYSFIGLIVFVAVYFLLTKPIYTQKLENLTIVEGEISSTIETKKVLIFDAELNEKIAEIPVENGEFRWETNNDIPFAEYRVEINKRNHFTHFSKGDDVFLKVFMNDRDFKIIERGTRKAESNYSKANSYSNFYNYTVASKLFLDEPDKFYKAAKKEWNSNKKAINNFRNKENIYLSKDFSKYEFQKIALKMLNALYDYQKFTSFEDEDYKIPADFEKELLSVIEKPEPLLYTTSNYKQYKINQLLPKEGTENPDSIIMVKLHKMPKSLEKDQLLSSQLIKLFSLTNEEDERMKIFDNSQSEFENEKYRNYVAENLTLINNQQKGKPFPVFDVIDKDGKIINLTEEFKGKFIVIDWWATWCAPCKQIKPTYEYEAKKYSGDNVVFVSISIDENKKAWDAEMKTDKSLVKNYWTKENIAQKTLGINSIPRFMLIDPEGKIYNADFARPGESMFSEVMSEITKNKNTFIFSF